MNTRELLTPQKTIAVVGLSDKPERPSYQVANYLLQKGFTIIPVNPMVSKVLGLKAYASIQDIPLDQQIDIVDIFRKSEEVLPIINEIIRTGRKPTVWMQEGVSSLEAKELAESHGMEVVMNACIMKVHRSSMSFSITRDDITLRTFEPSESDSLFKLIDTNRDHLKEWFVWVDDIKSVDDVQKYLTEQQTLLEKGKGLYLGIWCDDILSGIIDLEKIDAAYHSAELGYWLSKDCVGKGVMTRSCKLLIEYAFNERKLHRIDIYHAAGNERSKKVIEQLGFVHEGTMRESGYLHGVYVDHESYGLLENEWHK